MIRATKNYAYTWKNVSYVGSVNFEGLLYIYFRIQPICKNQIKNPSYKIIYALIYRLVAAEAFDGKLPGIKSNV